MMSLILRAQERYDVCDGTYFFPGGNPFLGPQGPDRMKHILCRYVNYQDVNNEQKQGEAVDKGDKV